jgi:hypothetical protein
MPVERLAPNKVVNFFKPFYNGFGNDAMIWFAYGSRDADQFERQSI